MTVVVVVVGHTLIALPLGPGRESILLSVRDEKKPNKNNSAQQQQQNKKGETVWLKLDVERLLIASIITRLSRPAHFGGSAIATKVILRHVTDY
jgi:hypothetical protein